MKYGLDAIPFRATQHWQKVSSDMRGVASLFYSKIALRLGNVKIVHVVLAKYFFKMSGISDKGPLATDCYISINCSICM